MIARIVFRYWVDKYNLFKLFRMRDTPDFVAAFILKFIYPGALLFHCTLGAVIYRHTDPLTSGTYSLTHSLTHTRTDGRANRRMDGQTDRRMD